MYKNILLHLSLIDEIGASTIKHILENSTNIDLNEIYRFAINDFVEYFGLHQAKANLIIQGLKDRLLLDTELNLIQKNQINIISLDEHDYPFLLKQISAPPAVLYVKGNISNMQNSIAIVGSRKANYYGKQVIQSIVPELVNLNFCIVSGGAFGIDTMAHQEALKYKGKTVAVLGSGLLKPYPEVNVKLFEDIVAKGGGIVSCFPLNAEPLSGNFPARNRIISGLSKGTLVVQAAEKSGALITAHYALEQNREVFAIPGNINDPLSKGCNSLIKQGAKLVISASDIIEELDYCHDKLNNFKNINHQLDIIEECNDPIIAICKNPKSLDEITELTGLELNEVQIRLFDLQIQGKVEQNFAGLWELV